MRTIKFRAWDKRKNEWLHNYKKMGGFNLFGETIVLGGWLDGIPIKDWDDIEVQQFTGFFDKNGKEIYEGDIVTVSWLGKDEKPWIVTYVPPCFLAVRPSAYEYAQKMESKGVGNCWYTGIDSKGSVPETVVEVIGNIFENKELLT